MCLRREFSISLSNFRSGRAESYSSSTSSDLFGAAILPVLAVMLTCALSTNSVQGLLSLHSSQSWIAFPTPMRFFSLQSLSCESYMNNLPTHLQTWYWRTSIFLVSFGDQTLASQANGPLRYTAPYFKEKKFLIFSLYHLDSLNIFDTNSSLDTQLASLSLNHWLLFPPFVFICCCLCLGYIVNSHGRGLCQNFLISECHGPDLSCRRSEMEGNSVTILPWQGGFWV